MGRERQLRFTAGMYGGDSILKDRQEVGYGGERMENLLKLHGSLELSVLVASSGDLGVTVRVFVS